MAEQQTTEVKKSAEDTHSVRPDVMFRVWHDGMHYPPVITFDTEMVTFVPEGNGGGSWRISKSKVMRNTGLKDKNGVDIYEGDLYHWDAGRGESEEGQIVFTDASFKCFTDPKARNYDLHSMKLNIVVIGNIYEGVKSGT